MEKVKTVSEKSVEKTLIDGVEDLGGMAVKFFPAYYAGFPDRIVIMPGNRVYFVELKAPGKDSSPIQQVVHKRLRKRDADVRVLDSKEAVNEFLKEISA